MKKPINHLNLHPHDISFVELTYKDILWKNIVKLAHVIESDITNIHANTAKNYVKKNLLEHFVRLNVDYWEILKKKMTAGYGWVKKIAMDMEK